MIIKKLQKRRNTIYGGSKYFIDCSNIHSDVNAVVPTHVIKNADDISILQAVINYSKYDKKNKNIVVKIAHKNKTNKKEYNISETLQNIPCFIKYICLFNCFDDTFNYISSNKTVPHHICTADNIGDNDNYVLVSPYINGGSIRNYAWNINNVHVLKSLLNQCIISLMYAFIYYGFLHNDLHLDNILFKKTKLELIHYADIDVVTNGHMAVIMDFDSSFIGINETQTVTYFWSNLYNMLSRIKFDLKDKITAVKNFDNIILFVSTAEIKDYEATRAKELVPMMNSIEFINTQPLPVPTYNPNV